MKNAVLVVLQTLLFLLLFAAGSFMLPFFPSVPAWQVSTGPGRVFVLDGLIFAALVYIVVLAIEAARRQLRGAGALTTLSFALAVVLGLAMKIGFKSL